jgi:hypothetical protein
MTRFKDFGKGDTNPNAEPVSFKIYDEEFYCVKELQGRVLLELIADSGSESSSQQATVITKFFSKVLLPESWERFSDLLDDQNKIVSVDTLGEITTWLVEEYSNRPEVRSQDS